MSWCEVLSLLTLAPPNYECIVKIKSEIWYIYITCFLCSNVYFFTPVREHVQVQASEDQLIKEGFHGGIHPFCSIFTQIWWILWGHVHPVRCHVHFLSHVGLISKTGENQARLRATWLPHPWCEKTVLNEHLTKIPWWTDKNTYCHIVFIVFSKTLRLTIYCQLRLRSFLKSSTFWNKSQPGTLKEHILKQC